MKGVPAMYLGRIVSKDNFRTFIYATDSKQQLVESWDEYEASMQTGLWFATKEDALASVAKKAHKTKATRTYKTGVLELKQEEPTGVLGELEIEQDDFLPNSASN
jgi:hypothetical protein